MWLPRIRYDYLSLLLLFQLVLTGCGDEKPSKKQLSPAAQLAQAKKIEDPTERGKALTQAGLRYFQSSDKQGARSALLQATDAADEIKKRDATQRAAVYTALSAAWYQVENTNNDNCKYAYRDAEQSVRKIDDPVEQTEALLNLAELKFDIDKKSDVEKHLNAGVKGIKSIDDPVERVRLLGKIARFYLKVGDDSAAKAAMQSAQELAASEQDGGTQGKLLVLIAQEQMGALNDREGGEANLKKAQELADSLSNNPNRKVHLLIDVAQVFVAMGQKPKARELLDEAENIGRGRSECKPAMDRIAKIRERM